MSRVTHYYAAENTTRIQGFFTGDLRGQFEFPNGTTSSVSYSTNGLGDYKGVLIDKFYSLSVSGGVEDPENEILGGLRYVRNLPVYRASQVYLRLAEAINRYGRPATAFAILAYGLNKTTLANASRIPVGERTGRCSWILHQIRMIIMWGLPLVVVVGLLAIPVRIISFRIIHRMI